MAWSTSRFRSCSCSAFSFCFGLLTVGWVFQNFLCIDCRFLSCIQIVCAQQSLRYICFVSMKLNESCEIEGKKMDG